jgi:hypothetical protein
MVQRCGGYTYEQGELRDRVRKERGGNEIDRHPLISMQSHAIITTHFLS